MKIRVANVHPAMFRANPQITHTASLAVGNGQAIRDRPLKSRLPPIADPIFDRDRILKYSSAGAFADS